jgi:hypothetical protein
VPDPTRIILFEGKGRFFHFNEVGEFSLMKRKNRPFASVTPFSCYNKENYIRENVS